MNNTIIETCLKAYCGYLRDKTPMQAARIKVQLDKITCYTVENAGNSRTITTTEADFVVKMVYGENREPEMTEAYTNQYTGKKVKAYYGLYVGNISYEIKKTLFDFAMYLRENFKTFEEAIEADNKEYTRLESERIWVEQKAREAEENEKAHQREKAEFDQKLLDEAAALIGTKVHEVTRSVLQGTDLYTKYDPDAIDVRFMRLYVMAKDIENLLAKEELCTLLHNGNTISIKLFGIYSGVKMPKSHKERINLINGLTQADIKPLDVDKFINKPARSKAKKGGKNKTYTFFTANRKTNSEGISEIIVKQETGSPIKLRDAIGTIVNAFVNKSAEGWHVTEKTTGLGISLYHATKHEALERAKNYISNNDFAKMCDCESIQAAITKISEAYTSLDAERSLV